MSATEGCIDVAVKDLTHGVKFTPRVSGYSPRTVVWVKDMRNSAYDTERDIQVCYDADGVRRTAMFKADARVRLVEESAG